MGTNVETATFPLSTDTDMIRQMISDYVSEVTVEDLRSRIKFHASPVFDTQEEAQAYIDNQWPDSYDNHAVQCRALTTQAYYRVRAGIHDAEQDYLTAVEQVYVARRENKDTGDLDRTVEELKETLGATIDHLTQGEYKAGNTEMIWLVRYGYHT